MDEGLARLEYLVQSGQLGLMYGDDYFSGLTTIRFPVEAIK
jgi:hypothetical protein